METLVNKLFGANGDRLSYRRLLVFIVVCALSTWLVHTGSLDGEQWVSIVKWVSTAFIGIEGATKIATAWSSAPAYRGAPTPAVSDGDGVSGVGD